MSLSPSRSDHSASEAEEPVRRDHMHFEDPLFSPQLLKGLSQLQQDQKLTDIKLEADGVSISCHRVVLSAASPYFNAMFTSTFEESTSPVVQIKSTDHGTLQSIVNYMYSAEIDITTKNVQSLAQASDEFQLETLRDACEKFMQEQVDSENCISFTKFGHLYSLKSLEEKARNMMLTKFSFTIKTSDFLELTEEELLDYISDDDLEVPNEDIVFEAVILWVNRDLRKRRSVFKRVVAHVRLPYCTSEYLCHVVKDHQLMSSAACQSYLEEAEKFKMLPDRNHEIVSERTYPRKSFDDPRQLVLLCGFTGENQDRTECWGFKEDTSAWEFLTDSPLKKGASSICCVRGNIYILEAFGGCWMYDTYRNKWEEMPSVGGSYFNHATVAHSDHFYAVGGSTLSNQPMEFERRFDTRSREWSDIAPMKKKDLLVPMTASFGQHVYVFGGLHKREPTCFTQQYDTVLGEWSLKADMPLPCDQGAAAVYNKQIFIVGGLNHTCESYTPASNVWAELSQPFTAHGFAPAVVWRGRIVVGGGCVDYGVRDNPTWVIEEYDPETDEWSYWNTPMKVALWGHMMLNISS